MWAIKALAGICFAVLASGCAGAKGPAKEDIQKVIQAEFERQVSYTPGATIKVTDWSGLDYECKQGATPSDSDLYHCTLSNQVDIFVRIEGKDDQNVEQAVKGVMSFKKNANGDWAVVSWEGA